MQKQYNDDYNESKKRFSYIIANTGIITEDDAERLFDLISSDLFEGVSDTDVEVGIFLFLCSKGLDFDEVITYYNETMTIDKVWHINNMIVNSTDEITKLMVDLKIKELV